MLDSVDELCRQEVYSAGLTYWTEMDWSLQVVMAAVDMTTHGKIRLP